MNIIPCIIRVFVRQPNFALSFKKMDIPSCRLLKTAKQKGFEKTMIQEIYINNELKNTFTNKYDIVRSILDSFYCSRFVNKTYKLKEKTNHTDKMELIFYYNTYDVDGNITKVKYHYKNIPCTSNRLDTKTLLDYLKYDE